MKPSLIKLNKFMPLLTDTLPFETPVLFSNRGFYETIKNEFDIYYSEQMQCKSRGEEFTNLSILECIKEFFFKNSELKNISIFLNDNFYEHGFLPYEFMVNKNQTSLRKISLIHPLVQIQLCDIYAKYTDELLYYTNKTNVSLRHPTSRAKKIYRHYASLFNKLTKENEEISEEPSEEGAVKILNDNQSEVIIPNNFFVYKKYRHLYSFYESKKLQDLENKFEYCYKFDIKRCFESIYTHSIAWAIKNKEYIKENLSPSQKSFENELDKIMRNSNWNETHGIPVGSEFSRIFAEIILQRIDLNVEKQLTNNYMINGKKIIINKDFVIKRFVDDYFIFVTSHEVGETILKTYEQALLEYKLFINEAKTEIIHRPFVTSISIAKQRIVPNLKNAFLSFHGKDWKNNLLSKENLFINYTNKLQTMINEIRVITVENNVNIIDLANIILSEIKIELIALLKVFLLIDFSIDNDINIQRIIKHTKRFLNDVLELTFYIFHLSSKANSAYGVCKISCEILELLDHINDNKLSGEIKQKMYTHFLIFLENKKNLPNSFVEYLDIIWIIEKLGDPFLLDQSQLYDILRTKQSSYFEYMVILSFIKNKPEYANIKCELIETIYNRLNKYGMNSFYRCELFMMFFDSIKCPYIDLKNKKKLLNVVGIKKNHKEVINFIKNKKWFYGWNEDITLKKLFEIKELQKIY